MSFRKKLREVQQKEKREAKLAKRLERRRARTAEPRDQTMMMGAKDETKNTR
jgi:hypothetical protein